MTLREFSQFAHAWIQAGATLAHVKRKNTLANYGSSISETSVPRLLYAANQKLDAYLSTGKYGDTQVVAVFAGRCLNNNPDTGDCEIQTTKPKGCRSYKFDGSECEEARSTNLATNFIPLSELV